MIDVDDIRGWKSGGAMAGQGLTILGTNKETEVVCYIKTIGPGTHTSTSYTVGVSYAGNKKIIEGRFSDKTKAKIRAADFMNSYPVVHMSGDRVKPKLEDGDGNRIRV